MNKGSLSESTSDRVDTQRKCTSSSGNIDSISFAVVPQCEPLRVRVGIDKSRPRSHVDWSIGHRASADIDRSCREEDGTPGFRFPSTQFSLLCIPEPRGGRGALDFNLRRVSEAHG